MRLERQDRAADREIIGGAARGRRNQDSVAEKLAHPLLPIDRDCEPRALRGLPVKVHLVDGERLKRFPRHVLRHHLERINHAELGARNPSMSSLSWYSFIRKPTEPRCIP